ncbi:MAG: 1-deoxy-D-xylulose-5-phosphate reductoisomerase [Pseudomonadota bacterium]
MKRQLTESANGANSPQSGAQRRVSILGSTGSVGTNTIDLIEREREQFDIVALTAHSNVSLLAQQAKALQPQLAVIGDENLRGDLSDALAGSGIEIAAGRNAVINAAREPADWVMSAIVGAAGLEPTLEAVEQGATVALANKETLVCAGSFFNARVSEFGATLLPVDSEHNAIFQVFDFARPERVTRVILTASGGPFRTRDAGTFKSISPAEAVAHPNWDMGAKISVDSATMMNKGLELIEAYHLFPIDIEQLDVLVHPQSVVHSMVEYVDGSTLAQLGSPDMRTPIGYALGWPDRVETPSPKLDLAQVGKLEFYAPDYDKFRCLALARAALAQGGGAPAILNAANEIAVAAFLQKRVGFLDIVTIVEETLEHVEDWPLDSLSAIKALDGSARSYAATLVDGYA